jgi:hypothetical protein
MEHTPPARPSNGRIDTTGAPAMNDQKPNYNSTAEEIIDYYDSHLTTPTLKELADMTGRTIPYLKGLLMHPGKVKA